PEPPPGPPGERNRKRPAPGGASGRERRDRAAQPGSHRAHRAGDRSRRRSRSLRRALIALAWSVVTPALVAQQRFEAAASAAAMEVRVDAGSGVERFSGPLIGGEGVVNAGRWTFALRLGDGSLTARTSGGVNRDVGELA